MHKSEYMLTGEDDDLFSAIVNFLRQINLYKMLYMPEEEYAQIQFAFSLLQVHSDIGFVNSVLRPLCIKAEWITTVCLKSKLIFFQ